MRPGLLATLTLATLIAGCGATNMAAPAPTPAASAELSVDPVTPALEAYRAAVAAPDNGAGLRQALDQVELALALASSDPGRRAELSAAELDLLARIQLLESGEASGATATPASPSPEAEPPATTATPGSNAGAAEGQVRPVVSAAARPAGPTFTLNTRKSFEGSGNSGQFASCIDVQILGRSGPVAGAVIGINNGDHSYQDQTDQSGYAGRCGLGASTWSVVIFWTPGGGQAQGATTTVYVSGAPEQRAAVVFQGR